MAEPDPREDHAEVIASVVRVAREMFRSGLVVGTAGNVSARLGDGTIALTPSSMPYPEMTADDVVRVRLDGEQVDGAGSPSSEKSLHLECYRRHPEVGAVLHCHPAHASMFAVAQRPIPAVIEEAVVYIGGDVGVCGYQRTGGTELADVVAAALGDRGAVLMANHGLVCVGRDTDDALHVAHVVEHTAHIVWGASLLGGVEELSPDVVGDFAGVYRFVRAEMWHTDGG